MKKALALVLAAVMAFSLAACSQPQQPAPAAPAQTTAAAPAAAAPAAPAAPAAAAPAETAAPAAEASGRDTLYVISSLDPGTFQPGNNDEQGYNRIMRQIYECLFFLDKEGEVQPWLATGYEWVDDVTCRVPLRDDVLFSDGTPFTADDVVFTVTHAKEDALPIAVYNLIEEVTAEDEHTVVFKLTAPIGSFPARMAQPQTVIGSKKAFEESGGDYLGGAVIGTGPYVLTDYFAGDMVKFAANEHYWREGEPKIKKIEYRLISSDTTRASEAQSLSTDIVINPNVKEIPNINAVNGINTITALSASTTYLLINTTEPTMSDVRVREAFARAINVPATIKLVYGDFGSAATGMVCPGILGYNEETYKKYFGAGGDAETAKQLLADAGYPNGIELELVVESTDTARCEMAEAFQAQVEAAGIKLKVNKMDSGLMRDYIGQSKHQMCIYGWTCTTKEADGMLQNIQPGAAALKRVNYGNQAFFDRYQEGCATQDRAERGKIWEDCLEMLAQDYVLVPIWHKALAAAVKDEVEGFYLTTDYEEHYFQWVTIK